MGGGGGGGFLKKAFDFTPAGMVLGELQRPGMEAAAAAERAAMAQQGAAGRQYAITSQLTEKPTAEAMLTFDKSLAAQERNLARQEQLVSQIDPTILEASQQALRLLRGESSSTLAPLQQQRDTQRQKLLNNLREQLGPGAETSTAGMQALSRFDSETSNIMSGAQQQALGNLGALTGQFTAARPDILRETQGFGNLATGRAGLAFTRAGLLSGQGQNVINTAGAENTGALMRAQGQQALYNQITGAGISAGSALLTGGLSSAGKVTNTPSTAQAGMYPTKVP